MRLCILTPLWPTREPDSGIANNMACQARALAALGHDVQVLYLCSHVLAGQTARVYLDHGLRIREIPTARSGRGRDLVRRMLAPWQALAELRRIDSELDAILTTSYEFPGLPYTWCRRRVPVLTRVSTTMATIGELVDPAHRRRLAIPAWFERLAVRASPLLCTHTQAHIELCARQMSVPARRFILIPHGMEFSPTPMVEIWSVPPTILFIGRMGRRKGTDVLLSAALRVLRTHHACRFELVGSDDEGLGVKFSGEHPELVGRVVFRGRLSNSARDEALARCYLFVSPSPYESFGLTFLEAMNLGKPVIGCSGSGAAELIGDAGVVVPPDDVSALAEAIETFLQDPARRDRLARLAAQRARKFSIETTARRIEEVFLGPAATTPPAARP